MHQGVRSREDLTWIACSRDSRQLKSQALILGVPYENIWIGNGLPLPLFPHLSISRKQSRDKYVKMPGSK